MVRPQLSVVGSVTQELTHDAPAKTKYAQQLGCLARGYAKRFPYFTLKRITRALGASKFAGTAGLPGSFAASVSVPFSIRYIA